METAQVIQTVTIAIIGVLITAIVSIRKQSAEQNKGDRADTFAEMKTLIDVARHDLEDESRKRSAERIDLLKRLDDVVRENIDCQKRAARQEAQIEALQADIVDLNKQLVQMRRMKGIEQRENL